MVVAGVIWESPEGEGRTGPEPGKLRVTTEDPQLCRVLLVDCMFVTRMRSRAELCPPKIHFAVLIPSTNEGDCSWREGVSRVQLKLGH